MIEKKPLFWNRIFDVIWISIVALFANHLYNLKLDFKWDLDWSEIINIFLLVLSTTLYGVFYFNFEKVLSESDKKHQENEQEYSISLHDEYASITRYKDFSTCFSEEWTKGKKKYWALLLSILFMTLYTYNWNSYF